MSQKPIKKAAIRAPGDGFAGQDAVDEQSNTWITGTVSLTGVAAGPAQKSASLPVTIASDQPPVPVTGNVTTNMTQVSGAALSEGQKFMGQSLPVAIASDQSAVPVTVQNPIILAANILDGRQTFSSTTGATTLITIPAGRTWIGTIGASCSCSEAAAGTAAPKATATFTTTGNSVTPAAGTYFVVQAEAGANAATGLVGSEDSTFGSTRFVVVAGSQSATIAVASTNAGTSSLVEAFAVGELQ